MKKIKIVGLGGQLDQLPLASYHVLKEADPLYLRTADHPVVEELKAEGLVFKSYDTVYQAYDEEFDQVYPAIVQDLLDQAEQAEKPLVYAVPGHPVVGETTTQLLLQQTQVDIDLVGGHSFIDDLFQALQLDPINGFQLMDGMDFNPHSINSQQDLILMQVFHPFIASDVKVKLMRLYPDNHPVYRVDAAGSDLEQIEKVPLYELDYFEGVHNLMSVYVPALPLEEDLRSFLSTQNLVDAIIDPETGDPWVLSQTHQSLWPFLKEESLELKEAIEQDDLENTIEELGDVLMQVFYHAKLAENHYNFTIEDVLENLNKKLRRRHPHIFNGVQAQSIEDVELLWQDIKKKENEENSSETR